MSVSNPIENECLYRINGKLYTWCGWFGCQIESMEWRRLPAGTKRDLVFYDGNSPITVTVYRTERKWLRYRTTWAVSASGTHDEHDERIIQLRERLKRI